MCKSFNITFRDLFQFSAWNLNKNEGVKRMGLIFKMLIFEHRTAITSETYKDFSSSTLNGV